MPASYTGLPNCWALPSSKWDGPPGVHFPGLHATQEEDEGHSHRIRTAANACEPLHTPGILLSALQHLSPETSMGTL